MSNKPIVLVKEDLLKDKDYEDYIAANLQAAGLYVERSIIYREEAELIELDIFTTNFRSSTSIERELVEIKSGGWGFSDIFKIKGWMSFLNINKSAFVVKKSCDKFDFYVGKANGLSVDLIHNEDDNLKSLCDKFQITEQRKTLVNSIRYSFLLERRMLSSIKKLKKENPDNMGYKELDNYFHKVNSATFYSNSSLERVNILFQTYLDYKNIGARISSGGYDENLQTIQNFPTVFYTAEVNPVQIALYVEHLCRLTALKSCVTYLIEKANGQYDSDKFRTYLGEMSLPKNIKDGIHSITSDKYFHKYPVFWQMFTYVFGGFILTQYKDDEYKLLAELSGIPIEEVPNAFAAFNKFFPAMGGWWGTLTNSSIEWHNLFPIAFSGIGANLRIYLHTTDREDKTYNMLEKKMDKSKQKTIKDLVKWNNLAYKYLSENH